MNTVFNWIMIAILIAYWIFRVIVGITATFEIDFFVKPFDLNTEIIILFITLLAIIFIAKRKNIGVAILGISYAFYYIPNVIGLYQSYDSTVGGLPPMVTHQAEILLAVIAMLIVIGLILDFTVFKAKTVQQRSKKTNWFYDNDKFDKQKDDRDDKNNYRIY